MNIADDFFLFVVTFRFLELSKMSISVIDVCASTTTTHRQMNSIFLLDLLLFFFSVRNGRLLISFVAKET